MQYLKCSAANLEKDDIYNFGVILLEIITGKPVTSNHELEYLQYEVCNSYILISSAFERYIRYGNLAQPTKLWFSFSVGSLFLIKSIVPETRAKTMPICLAFFM